MTKLLLAFCLLPSLPLLAQANDSGHTINMHVTESRIDMSCSDVTKGNSSCGPLERLTVSVDGAKYELESATMLPKGGIVALGDYKAKLVSDKKKPTGEFNRTYELMFTDGSTRKFNVTGALE